MDATKQRWSARRVVTMAALILAGGVIYGMPYLRQNYHGPMRDALALTNTELGFVNSMFGLLALACYFPGGWLADRVNARLLLSVSLVGTGIGGLAFATLPSYSWVLAIHAFWGVSSILTFWAALIRATRNWGGESEQGLAFGVLDGGRGLVEAVLAAGALGLFAAFAASAAGLKAVITGYSVSCLAAAILVWIFIPVDVDPSGANEAEAPAGSVRQALGLPVAWLLALVILCAYAGYWGTFDLAAYAQDGYGQSDTYAAALGTFRLWIRPVAAVAAGILADRFRPSRIVTVSFLVLASGYALMAFFPPSSVSILWLQTAVVAFAVFALRGIYYSLLQEGAVPVALTGTVVGMVSVLGYTPDIFAPLGVGYLLDTYPGDVGHRLYFAILAGVSVLGAGAATVIRRTKAE